MGVSVCVSVGVGEWVAGVRFWVWDGKFTRGLLGQCLNILKSTLWKSAFTYFRLRQIWVRLMV